MLLDFALVVTLALIPVLGVIVIMVWGIFREVRRQGREAQLTDTCGDVL
jgi:hypothetical protein